jgi:hypothetical protein
MLRLRHTVVYLGLAILPGVCSAAPEAPPDPPRKEIRALLVNGRPGKERFDQATAFLSAACEVFSKDSPPADGPRIRHKVISMKDFSALGAKDLDKWDCVFLCDAPRLSADEARRLEAFVRGGGGVVFCLGPQVDVEAYNAELYRKGKGLLPVRLVKQRKGTDKQAFRFGCPENTFKEPPLNGFATEASRDLLGRVQFTSFILVEEPDAKAKVRTVLHFEEVLMDKPEKGTRAGIAMLEWRPFADGKDMPTGRVVLLTTTVNLEWNSWPVSPSFPVVVQELLRFVSPDRSQR